MSSQTLGKGTSVCLYILIQGQNPPTRGYTLVILSVGTTGKGLLTSSASPNLKRWVSILPITARTDTKFPTPRIGRFNSIRIKWVYHILTQKNRTWPSYKLSKKVFKGSPRNRLPQPNSLENPREWLVIHLRETSNPWWAKTWTKDALLLPMISLMLTPCLVQTSMVPGARQYDRIRIGWLYITLLY